MNILDIIAQAPDQVEKGVDAIGGAGGPSLESVLVTGIDVFLFFIGALSVIMIILGGFKYITSRGDSSAVSSAKNTIMYAVIGLIIAGLAYPIAHFVITIPESPDPFECNSSIDPGCNPS